MRFQHLFGVVTVLYFFPLVAITFAQEVPSMVSGWQGHVRQVGFHGHHGGCSRGCAKNCYSGCNGCQISHWCGRQCGYSGHPGHGDPCCCAHCGYVLRGVVAGIDRMLHDIKNVFLGHYCGGSWGCAGEHLQTACDCDGSVWSDEEVLQGDDFELVPPPPEPVVDPDANPFRDDAAAIHRQRFSQLRRPPVPTPQPHGRFSQGVKTARYQVVRSVFNELTQESPLPHTFKGKDEPIGQRGTQQSDEISSAKILLALEMEIE